MLLEHVGSEGSFFRVRPRRKRAGLRRLRAEPGREMGRGRPGFSALTPDQEFGFILSVLGQISAHLELVVGDGCGGRRKERDAKFRMKING